MTDRLAERVLGWRPAPDRFMTGARTYILRARFRPFTDIRDALRLAEKLTRRYSLTADATGFTAEIQYQERVERATANHKARAVTLAIARVLELDHSGVQNAIQKGIQKSS
jgi:phage-related baseplate assembly protein